MPKANAKIGGFLERLRHVVAAQSCRHRTDHDLLEEYVARQDEMAFAGLVDRYGPMVMGLCRRQLRHRQDAEDAFQAVFLVLARKAGGIRKSASLPGWLHSVALRAAMRLRAGQARRRARETALIDVAEANHGADVTVRETQQVLEEELDRLADKYRAPLLLCCVQGKTRDEAAQQLGWRLGVLRGRLDRGRELLRGRLSRRGVTLPAVLLPLGIAATSEAAVVPALLSSTVRAAVGSAHTQAATAALSAPAAALAQGVIQAMFLTKIKMCAAGLMLLAAVGTGAGVFTYRADAQERGSGAGEKRRGAAQAAKGELDRAELQREIERLRLELEQTRLLLKVAKEEILNMRDQVRSLKAAAATQDRAAKDVADGAALAREIEALERARDEEARGARANANERAAKEAAAKRELDAKRADVAALEALKGEKAKAEREERAAREAVAAA
jgi:RNA polymerase sigma factor (sigma-70 family)